MTTSNRSRATAGAPSILNRVVCDNHSDPQSVYQCEVTDVSGAGATTTGRLEGQAAVAPPLDDQINQVYDLLGDTYDYYKSMFNDVNGNPYDLTTAIGFKDENNPSYAPVLSATVNSCGVDLSSTCASDNAFWLPADNSFGSPSNWYVGGTMQIGAGLAGLSDVIAHEMEHGVTAAIANLTYQGQSGAINESLSDIFGEAVDHYRQQKYNETPDDWSIGEGHQWAYTQTESVPYLRSMKDPLNLPAVSDAASMFPLYPGQASTCTGWQPDKMSSPCWDTDPKNDDAGGVHTNSGVGNHLQYLMAVGGTFNGRTIRGMGEDYAMRVWWVAMHRMNKNETYYDLSRDLWAACLALQTTSTEDRILAPGTCDATVKPALLATEVSLRNVRWTSSIPKRIKRGSSLSLRATVSDARRLDARQALPDQKVALQRLSKGRWFTMAASTTDLQGAVAISVKPRVSGTYRYAVLPAATSPLMASAPVRVVVRR